MPCPISSSATKTGCLATARSCVVGVQGFEPWTPWSQTRCATGLRYTPKKQDNTSWVFFGQGLQRKSLGKSSFAGMCDTLCILFRHEIMRLRLTPILAADRHGRDALDSGPGGIVVAMAI